MTFLESLIGDANMQTFVKNWFMYNVEQEVTEDIFHYKILDFISSNYDIDTRETIITALDWDGWTTNSDHPVVPLDITQDKAFFATNLADDYITLDGGSSPNGASYFLIYPRQTKYIFIDYLMDKVQTMSTFNPAILTRIDGD